MTLLTARYVAPALAPTIERGAVLVRSGRVEAVGERSALSASSVIDYGDAVICPGFVNAHTHLELSHLQGLVAPGPDLAEWLWRLVQAIATRRSGLRADGAVPTDGVFAAPCGADDPSRECNVADSDLRDSHDAVLEGIRQSIAAGVTLVGDITREPGQVRPVLAASNLRSVSFGEVIAIGTRRALLTPRLEAATSAAHACARMRVGVSPHAPYTLEPDGLEACARRAAAGDLSICIHLAESRAEAAFTLRGDGPLAAHLKRLDSWDDRIEATGLDPVELVDRCGLLTRRTVAAHANYVNDAEIARLAECDTSVAYCPRTHAAFDHEPHRYRDMIRAGVNVCIGTDSLASNPSLSVLDELRFLWRRDEGLDPETLLRLGTHHGAIALGWSDSAGSIARGLPADLVVVPIDPGPKRHGLAAMFETDAPPRAVYINGVLQRAGR